MKKRIFSSILLVFIFVFLSACSFISDSKKEFTIFEGDLIEINVENKEIKSLSSNDSNIIECIEDTFVRAKSVGETSVIVEFENNKKDEYKFNVLAKEITKDEDYEKQNKQIVKDINLEIENFSKKIKRSNYLSIDAKTYAYSIDHDGHKTESEIETVNIKTRANPLQMEISSEDEFYILTKEEGEFYIYRGDLHEKLIRFHYAADEEEFKKLQEANLHYFEPEGLLDFEFNSEKGKAYYNGNYYIFHAYFEDCINDSAKKQIVRVLIFLAHILTLVLILLAIGVSFINFRQVKTLSIWIYS